MRAEPIPNGQRVRDYTVGFRYHARLFRHALDASTATAHAPRFALVVFDRAPDASPAGAEPVMAVTVEPRVTATDDYELVLASETPPERHGRFDELGEIEAFVDRAAELVCARLGVDRATFRRVPGSEPPPPWQHTPTDARLCRACGQALPDGAEHCQYCGAEYR